MPGRTFPPVFVTPVFILVSDWKIVHVDTEWYDRTMKVNGKTVEVGCVSVLLQVRDIA